MISVRIGLLLLLRHVLLLKSRVVVAIVVVLRRIHPLVRLDRGLLLLAEIWFVFLDFPSNFVSF